MSRFRRLLPRWLTRSLPYRAGIAIRRARQLRRDEQADDQRRLELYRRWLRPGGLAFDIGANLGNRTRIFSALGARVVAVEPQAHCQAALRWQFLLDPRVAVIAAAAGRNESPREIEECETDVLSSMNPDWLSAARSSGRYGEVITLRRVLVPCVTLDGLIRRFGRPDFIKIDVEGYESEVLAGLSRPSGAISIEFTPEAPQVALRCIDQLEQLGYSRYQFSRGETAALGPDWIGAGSIREQLRHSLTEFGDIYAEPSAPPSP